VSGRTASTLGRYAPTRFLLHYSQVDASAALTSSRRRCSTVGALEGLVKQNRTARSEIVSSPNIDNAITWSKPTKLFLANGYHENTQSDGEFSWPAESGSFILTSTVRPLRSDATIETGFASDLDVWIWQTDPSEGPTYVIHANASTRPNDPDSNTLDQELDAIFGVGAQADFEPGVTTTFEKSLRRLLAGSGDDTLLLLHERLQDFQSLGSDVAAVTIEAIGDADNANTLISRFTLLSALLLHDSPLVRDAAATAIVSTEHPHAVHVLQHSLKHETHPQLRSNLQQSIKALGPSN
jgi:hypothetical protein